MYRPPSIYNTPSSAPSISHSNSVFCPGQTYPGDQNANQHVATSGYYAAICNQEPSPNQAENSVSTLNAHASSRQKNTLVSVSSSSISRNNELTESVRLNSSTSPRAKRPHH